MSLALQAHEMGLVAHAMGGFDRAALTATLAVPALVRIDCVIALGRPGQPPALSEALRGSERPNGRRPLAELVMRGRFA